MSAKIWKSIVVAGTISLLWSPSVTIASVIITKQPESQIADYDGNATLSVIAFTLNEYLPLTYQWYRGTEEIEGANLPVLNLSGLKRGDDAVYYCRVRNRTGYLQYSNLARISMGKGSVVGWGKNNDGQCDGPPDNKDIVAIAAGEDHGMALKTDGKVVVWGSNYWAQRYVPPSLADVVAIAAGRDHCLALKADGTIVAWGSNEFGQRDLPDDLDNVVAIDAGAAHNIALLKSGLVEAWGNNEYGQCEVPTLLKNVKATSTSHQHSVALRKNGILAAWGSNYYGVLVLPAGLFDAVKIDAGYYHSLALRGDGTVVAWGDESVSLNIPAGLNNVVSVSAGYDNSIALKSDGTLAIWGGNNHGQADLPSDLSDVLAISCGDQYNLALKEEFEHSPVYRFWSDKYKGHFFTISGDEKNHIVNNLSHDWKYETVAYRAYKIQKSGTVPLYRFWSERYKGHFFTISENEKNNIIANLSRDWKYEKIAYYVYPNSTGSAVPVYRFWSNRYKHHFFTISESEKNNLIANFSHDWKYEGIAFYALRKRLNLPGMTINTVSTGSVPEAGLETASLESAAGDTLSVYEAGGDVSSASAEGYSVAGFAATGDNFSSDMAGVISSITFPIEGSGSRVMAYTYDAQADDWVAVLDETGVPCEVTLDISETDGDYHLAVFARDEGADIWELAYSSVLEVRSNMPDQSELAETYFMETGLRCVGVPVIKLQIPEDGYAELLAHSAVGDVELEQSAAESSTVEIEIPQVNTWYQIIIRESTEGGVLKSAWLRHTLPE